MHNFDFELTKEEIDKIDALEAGMRVCYAPNTRFTDEEHQHFKKYRIKHIWM